MRLGGRTAAAIDVLEDMSRRHRPASEALKDWGLSHRFAGAGDRAAIGNIVYDALRRRRSASWLLGADSPRAQALGALILEMKETIDSIGRAFTEDRFAPPPLTEEEIRSIAARAGSQPPDAVLADCPDWTVPLLEESFGPAWVDEARGLAGRPPLDLRVNTLKADRQQVLRELPGATATRFAPTGVRIAPVEGAGRHPNVMAEPAFRKGWFEIQDEGSQIVVELSGALPGMQVLDLCAGGGGKSLALSARMGNRGQIFAYDSDKERLAPIFERIRRGGHRNIQVLSRPSELGSLSGRMDLVLVDAPCTGSGTWRRRPDAKWRLTSRQLETRVGEQARILSDARSFVRPGGVLVYVTCSLFRDENQRRVEALVADDPAFSLADHSQLVEAACPTLASRARIDGGIVLTPAATGTDGFFFAAMRRTGQ